MADIEANLYNEPQGVAATLTGVAARVVVLEGLLSDSGILVIVKRACFVGWNRFSSHKGTPFWIMPKEES